jgi:hypothetical protein
VYVWIQYYGDETVNAGTYPLSVASTIVVVVERHFNTGSI